jgi:hypothetical protein
MAQALCLAVISREDRAGEKDATMDERNLLAERFDEHRSQVRAVAYRMLGSSSEPDAAVRLRPEVDRQAAMSPHPQPFSPRSGEKGEGPRREQSPPPCAQGRVPSGWRFGVRVFSA